MRFPNCFDSWMQITRIANELENSFKKSSRSADRGTTPALDHRKGTQPDTMSAVNLSAKPPRYGGILTKKFSRGQFFTERRLGRILFRPSLFNCNGREALDPRSWTFRYNRHNRITNRRT